MEGTYKIPHDQIEEYSITDILGLSDALTSLSNNKEDKANKKNSLAADPTNQFYPTVTAVNAGLATKQVTLVNQSNIKSINNISLLGSGNIDIIVPTVVPATPTVAGIIKIAGDISGTYDNITVPGLATKEPIIAGGANTQYWRGDKTWQLLNKAAVGLGNVDNTSDVNKPISTATQTALNLKADKTYVDSQDTAITNTMNAHIANVNNPHNTTATKVPATAHTVHLVGTNVQTQLDQTETDLINAFKIDKVSAKSLFQTGIVRPDTDVSTITISPANTLTITACNGILFVNNILPDTDTNYLSQSIFSFGNKTFIVNGTNTPLAVDTRGIFYVGLDKTGTQVYRTSRVYDPDVCYLARLIVQNSAGAYSIFSAKYYPDLAYNNPVDKDRNVAASGNLVWSGAASISFGNRGVSFTKNSINYSNSKLDPNYLKITDTVNPTPMQFLFFLPNITSLSVNISTITTINPQQWFQADGTVGGTNIANTSYQVYRLLVSVTGTMIIQVLASTSNAPQLGVNAIFSNRDDALAGLNSVIFPDVLPLGDSIVLGKFFLRAGTNANGSGMTDPNDFYFQPTSSTSSTSSIGVTEHDTLSGKNSNPSFQHATAAQISNWDSKQAALSGTGIVKSTAGVISYLTDNSANWNIAYTDRNKWDGGSSNLVPATGRTSLGGTTVGQSIFTLANPSAVTFLRMNADNSVSALDSASYRAAIGAGTVTSVAPITLGTTGTDLSSSVATGTTTPVITLNVPTASALNRGVLTAADWSKFNNKQDAITNPIGGVGTTYKMAKWSSPSTLVASLLSDNGTNVFLGDVATPVGKFDINTGSVMAANPATQIDGSLSFGNLGSATQVPSLVGKSSNSVGLYLAGVTADSNSLGDLVLDIRRNDNQDYGAGVLGNKGLVISRFGTPLITMLRSGATTFVGNVTAPTFVGALSGNATNITGIVSAVNGGTGLSGYAVGDLLYASSATALSKLADVATGNSLISGGVGVAPSWGKIGLTTHVSGVLPIANGGTNGSAAPTAGGVSYGTGTAYAFSAAGTSGQFLKSNAATAPTWQTLSLTDLPGSSYKASVKATTTADLGASAATHPTITGPTGAASVVFPNQDGIAIALNDRILVKNQATASQNGIYYLSTQGVAATSPWVLTRALDADTSAELAGGTVNVDSGTVNGGNLYTTSLKTTDTVGTTAMNWYKILDESNLLASPSSAVGAVKYNGTAQLAGAFDGGTTSPTATSRLNYNGYFYARIFNSPWPSETTAASHYYFQTGSDGFIRNKPLANVQAEIVTSASVLAATGAALTTVDDTNITLTLGGTPATSLLRAASITAGWTGTLADARIASAANWNAAYSNRISSLTVTGSSGAATLSSNVLNIPTYTLAGLGGINFSSVISGFVTGANSTVLNTDSLEVAIEKLQGQINSKSSTVGTVTAVAMSVPTGLDIAGSPITSSGTLALTYTPGYAIPTTAKQTEWDTAYTNRITSLTTTGASGAATLASNVLNVPNYTLSGLGGINFASVISGFATGANSTVLNTDSLEVAIEKLQGQVNARTSNVGTVTSVAALTLGTTGTDVSSTVATPTTTPVITLNLPSASATNRGLLTAADWINFNSKTSNVGTVTSVAALTLGTTGTDVSSTVATGTTTPVITLNLPSSSATNRGLLTAADWTAFNGKLGTISGIAAGGELAGTYPNPTLVNASVIGKVLTGYVSGAGTVAATDTILQAIQKINGNDVLKAPLASPTFTGVPAAPTAAVGTSTTQLATTAFVNAEIANDAPSKTGTGASGTWGISITGNAATVTTNANLTGEVTSVGNATTVTNSAVLGKVLTGFNAVGTAILATDTILQAFGKAQSQINGLTGGVNYLGLWNASTNTPALANGSGAQGDLYIVSVAGSTSLDGISSWAVGDRVYRNATVWTKPPAPADSVISVNGFTGAVSLASNDIAESGATNRWYTPARESAKANTTTTISTTSPLTGGGDLSANRTIAIPAATTSVSGYLTSADWTNFNTAYTDRMKWDGGATGLVAATGRTSLGGSTLGQNIFTGANPSAVRFLRANADNSITWLDAPSMVTALSALPASSYTAADVLSKLITVDGASSGLDADLLDGNHASAFALSAHTHNSIVPVSAADANVERGAVFNALTFTSGSVNFPTAVGGGLEYRRAAASASSLGTFQIVTNNNSDNNLYFRKVTAYSTSETWSGWGTIWSSINDGAASGLDADLLDGMQPSSSNVANTIVNRDASGNISVGSVSGSLTGNVTGNVSGTAGNVTGIVAAVNGGTGQSAYAIGDLLQGASATTLSKLAAVATGNVLLSGGVATLSSWGKVGLTTHVSGILPIANGGTGYGATPPAGSVAVGNGSIINYTAAGTSGQFLKSAGTGTPVWASITATDISGVLDEVNGGTGQSSYAVGDLLYASASTVLSKLADVATGNSLISGGVGVAPSWGKIGLTTHVSGVLPVGSGGTGTGTALTAGGVLYGSSATAMLSTVVGTSGQFLKSNAAAAPSWATLSLTDLPASAYKESVKAATTADLGTLSATTSTTLTGPAGASAVVFPNQDGIVIALNDRILVKNQNTQSQNGIYYLSTQGIAATTAWVLTRALDADTAAELCGGTVNVDSGAANGGSLYTTALKSSDTVGTTSMPWYKILDESNLLTVSDTKVGAVKYNGTTSLGGAFDGGTTNPTLATRLNYNGIFYTSAVNITNTATLTSAAVSYNFMDAANPTTISKKALADVRTEVALNAPLTGYVVGSNTAIAATDTILAAFNKVQGQINARTSGVAGTAGTIAQFTAAGTIGNSIITQTAGAIAVAGTVTGTGFYNSSDARLKEIIKRTGDMVVFKWKDGRDDKKHYGYIADEVEKKMPDAVSKGEDGMLSVNYIEVLVKKISNLEKKVKDLVNKLKNK